jgi:uncharacterized repeat protein (TIGR02543 family)
LINCCCKLFKNTGRYDMKTNEKPFLRAKTVTRQMKLATALIMAALLFFGTPMQILSEQATQSSYEVIEFGDVDILPAQIFTAQNVNPTPGVVNFGNAMDTGRVSSADATYIARWLIQRSFPINRRAADVDANGKIEFVDVIKLMQILVGYDLSHGLPRGPHPDSLVIFPYDEFGNPIYEIELYVKINNNSKLYQIESGVLSIWPIPAGATVSVGRSVAPNTDYQFLRWEHSHGETEFSALSAEPEFIMPEEGGAKLFAVFETVFEDFSLDTPLEWCEELAAYEFATWETELTEFPNEWLAAFEEMPIDYLPERGDIRRVRPSDDFFERTGYTAVLEFNPYFEENYDFTALNSTLQLSRSSWNNPFPFAWGQEVVVTSNTRWNTSSSHNWLFADEHIPLNQTGNGGFIIFNQRNPLNTPRSPQGTITVRTQDNAVTRTVTVNQVGGAALYLDYISDIPSDRLTILPNENATLAFPATADFHWIDIWSSRTWNVSVTTAPGTGNWLSVPPASIWPADRECNGEFVIVAQANPNQGTRTGTVTVTAGGITRTISVTQQGVGTIFEAPHGRVTAQPSAGSLGPLNINANVTWTATSSVTDNPRWLTVTPASHTGNGSITINATANPGGTREGTITIAAPGTGLPSSVITFVQLGAQPTTLDLPGNLWQPTANASHGIVNVTSNGTWNISVNQGAQNWLTISNITPAGRTGNGSFILNTTANHGAERTGTITVTVGTVTRTITVIQQGQNAVLALNRSAWAPTATSNFVTVNVTANGVWNLPTSNASWLTISHVTPTNRNGNGSFRINVTANTGTSARTGTITVTRSGVTRTVNVTQVGATASNTIDNANWIMFNDSPSNFEFYVTEERVASFQGHNNTFFGMTRIMSGGQFSGRYGGLYAQGLAGNWTRIGRLTFPTPFMPFSEEDSGEYFGALSAPAWARLDNGNRHTINSTTPTTNLNNSVLYSLYFWHIMTLTFNGNGGTPATQTRTIQREAGVTPRVGNLPAAPTRTGFEFVGWFDTQNPTGGTRITETTTVSPNNINFWARWTPALNIINPANNAIIPVGTNLVVTWTPNSLATHRITLQNRNTGATPVNNELVQGSSFTINQSHLTAGNRFTVEITATIGSGWARKTVDFVVQSADTLGVHVTVSDSAGRPISNALVQFVRYANNDGHRITFRTNASGIAIYPNAPAATWGINVTHPDYASTSATSRQLTRSNTTQIQREDFTMGESASTFRNLGWAHFLHGMGTPANPGFELSSVYGYRAYAGRSLHIHAGIDLIAIPPAVTLGRVVTSPFAGRVEQVFPNSGPAGFGITISYNSPTADRYYIRLLHLQQLPARADGTLLAVGDYVNAGAEVGRLGGTMGPGNPLSIHKHFDVHRNFSPVGNTGSFSNTVDPRAFYSAGLMRQWSDLNVQP